MEEKDLDQPIYRIMPIHRLLESFENNELVLVKPKKWGDPFENAMLSAPVLTSAGETGEFTAKDKVFGQCWTLHEETDAMWRIYSPNKQSAKLRTTPRKIFEALKTTYPDFWELRCFIGSVEYYEENDLRSKLQGVNLFDTNGSGIAESLMYKRIEFEHEKEVRIIYSDSDNVQCSKDIFPFNIIPNTLFEEIIFDPRMNTELTKAYELALESKGFENPIKQSTLYNRPSGFTINI